MEKLYNPRDFRLVTVTKTADQTKNSDTTLADDTELSLPVAADSLYHIELMFAIVTDPTPDWKYKISIPAGGNCYSMYGGGSRDYEVAPEDINTAVAVTVAAGATEYWLHINGRLKTVSAGFMTLQWAQNQSNAAATTVKAGSYMLAIKL